jgi:hypothetical protein
MWEWRYSSTILSWRRMISFMLLPLYPQGNSPVPIVERLRGVQRWSGYYGDERNLLLQPGIEPRLLGQFRYCL